MSSLIIATHGNLVLLFPFGEPSFILLDQAHGLLYYLRAFVAVDDINQVVDIGFNFSDEFNSFIHTTV